MPMPGEFAEVTDPEIADLLTAFWSYETALGANDVPALEGWFAAEYDTLRTDGAISLVGHDEISAFRRGRVAPPPRRVQRLHMRPAGSGAVLLVAETVRADGTRGGQSRLWIRRPEGWRVTAAHVADSPPQPVQEVRTDGIFRRTGTPLVAGAPDGRLSATTIAVKDLFAIAGERIGAGNPDWLAEAAPQSRHADAVAALLDAGGQVIGIAQSDDFAYSMAGANPHYPTPENAAAPGHLPGGSSNGPAAAVAAGLADLGLGTDTAGSVRVPASYCGLYGIRPTHGAVSMAGVHPLAPSFDTAGWLARDPGLLRRAGDVLLPSQDPEPVQALLIAHDLLDVVDEPMRLAFVAGVRAFAGGAGLPLRIVDSLCEGHLEEWVPAFRTAQSAEAWDAHGAWVDAHPGSLDPAVAERFAAGKNSTKAQRAEAADVLVAARKTLQERIAPGTALALPASSTPAPARDADPAGIDRVRAGNQRLTCLASLAGLPAVVAPTLRVGTLPAGLCFVGAPGADRALLSLLTS
jgi:amidase